MTAVAAYAPQPRPSPPGPRGLPAIGSLLEYRRNPVLFFHRLSRDYGDIASFTLGPYPGFLVSHPEGIRHVISANDRNYCRGRFYENFQIFFGRGLLTLDGDDWKAHRRVTQPAFLRTVVTSASHHVAEATEQVLDSWQRRASAGEPVDLVPDAMELTLATLSRTLFGIDVSPGSERVREAIDFGVRVMFNQGTINEMLPTWLPTPRNRGIARHQRVLSDMVDRILMEHREADATVDLVSLIDGAAGKDPGSWSPQDVRDEVTTVFLAGQETTAMALCWLLYVVARHPEVRDRLEAEADAVPDSDLLAPGAEGLLPFTRAVIDETLRLYPPIWLYTRDAVEDDEILGYHVPAGSSVLVSPFATHRRPDLWERPDEFVPERFLGDDRRHRFAYFPFGGGPRQCIGSHMALHELMIILALTVRRFRWSLDGRPDLDVGVPVISLRPLQDVRVRFVPRRDPAA